MRFALLLAAAIVLGSGGARAATLSPDQAAQHIGQTVDVRGIVAGIGHGRSGIVFVDFGAPYPDATFVAVIFPDDASAFHDVDQLEGKTITIHGMLQLYRGRPEIILRAPGQIIAR